LYHAFTPGLPISHTCICCWFCTPACYTPAVWTKRGVLTTYTAVYLPPHTTCTHYATHVTCRTRHRTRYRAYLPQFCLRTTLPRHCLFAPFCNAFYYTPATARVWFHHLLTLHHLTLGTCAICCHIYYSYTAAHWDVHHTTLHRYAGFYGSLVLPPACLSYHARAYRLLPAAFAHLVPPPAAFACSALGLPAHLCFPIPPRYLTCWFFLHFCNDAVSAVPACLPLSHCTTLPAPPCAAPGLLLRSTCSSRLRGLYLLHACLHLQLRVRTLLPCAAARPACRALRVYAFDAACHLPPACCRPHLYPFYTLPTAVRFFSPPHACRFLRCLTGTYRYRFHTGYTLTTALRFACLHHCHHWTSLAFCCHYRAGPTRVLPTTPAAAPHLAPPAPCAACLFLHLDLPLPVHTSISPHTAHYRFTTAPPADIPLRVHPQFAWLPATATFCRLPTPFSPPFYYHGCRTPRTTACHNTVYLPPLVRTATLPFTHCLPLRTTHPCTATYTAFCHHHGCTTTTCVYTVGRDHRIYFAHPGATPFLPTPYTTPTSPLHIRCRFFACLVPGWDYRRAAAATAPTFAAPRAFCLRVHCLHAAAPAHCHTVPATQHACLPEYHTFYLYLLPPCRTLPYHIHTTPVPTRYCGAALHRPCRHATALLPCLVHHCHHTLPPPAQALGLGGDLLAITHCYHYHAAPPCYCAPRRCTLLPYLHTALYRDTPHTCSYIYYTVRSFSGPALLPHTPRRCLPHHACRPVGGSCALRTHRRARACTLPGLPATTTHTHLPFFPPPPQCHTWLPSTCTPCTGLGFPTTHPAWDVHYGAVRFC